MKDTPTLTDANEVSTPEPFRYETKFLVLKFLGLTHPGSSFSSSGSGSSHNDSSEISPNSSILVNYQSSRSISHTSEDNWSWKSGSHSSSGASAGRLNLSSSSAGLKEFRSSSQPQASSDHGEFQLHVHKTSKSTPLTPNSSFSSEASLNASKDLLDDEVTFSPSQHITKKNAKVVKSKPSSQGEKFVSNIPDLESPIYGDHPFQAHVESNFLRQSSLEDCSPESEVDLPTIPISHKDSADTIKAADEGRHSRQEVITSDSYESVDTLLGEEYQQVESDGADVFDDEDGVVQKGGMLQWDDIGDTPGEESDVSGEGEDEADGAGLQAVGGTDRPPAFMDLLPGPSQPPDVIHGTQQVAPPDRSIKRGAGDRAGLNLDGLTHDTLTVETPILGHCRRYSINTTVNYLQDDVNDAMTDLQVELDEASRNQHTPVTADGLFAPQSPCTNAAHILGVIGDQVNRDYSHLLEQASHRVLRRPTELVDYDDFRETAEQIVQETAETMDPNVRPWFQAGLLLCFSKRVAMGMIQHGERGLGRIVDYTTRAIEDTLANYIINAGGWNSVGELNLTASPLGSSLSLSTHTPSPSSEVNPFFPRASSSKPEADSDPEERIEPEPGPGSFAASGAEVIAVDEVDEGVDLAIFEDRPRTETAIFHDTEIVDEDGAQGDGFEIIQNRKREERRAQTFDRQPDVSNDVDDDAGEEQSRVNRYLGYVQAGMNMVALSAGVALSLIRRQ